MRTLSFLDQFPAIAWDVDNTLVGHSANRLFFPFIRDRRAIQHHIVSFRSHGAETEIFPDIFIEGGPPSEFFSGVHTVDADLWEAHERDRMLRRYGRLDGAPTAAETAYRSFKALTCKALGIPVLIDDDTPNCAPGCTLHGILLIHPDEFLRTQS